MKQPTIHVDAIKLMSEKQMNVKIRVRGELRARIAKTLFKIGGAVAGFGNVNATFGDLPPKEDPTPIDACGDDVELLTDYLARRCGFKPRSPIRYAIILLRDQDIEIGKLRRVCRRMQAVSN